MARRRATLLSPVALVRRNGLYKGGFGGSKGWLAAGGAVWVAGYVRRSLGKNEEVAAIEKLKPGEFVTIRTITPPTRSQRKADKRAAKKAGR